MLSHPTLSHLTCHSTNFEPTQEIQLQVGVSRYRRRSLFLIWSSEAATDSRQVDEGASDSSSEIYGLSCGLGLRLREGWHVSRVRHGWPNTYGICKGLVIWPYSREWLYLLCDSLTHLHTFKLIKTLKFEHMSPCVCEKKTGIRAHVPPSP